MEPESVSSFFWPEISRTVSVVALALAVAVFVFGAFSGARANKFRIVFAVILSSVIGCLTMPLAVKAARALHILGTKTGVVVLVTAMMVLVAAVATTIYEIVTVTMPDIGLTPRK